MGDDNRFSVLSGFIEHNFPPPLRVADVAGGKGNLSFLLAQRGYDCTVIDPRKTDLSKPERQLANRKRIRFKRIRAHFTAQMAEDFDLIVGLHPDGATETICEAAKIRPVVLVPCCKFWNGIESHGSASIAEAIRRYFKWNQIDWWETTLSMQGKNLVFVIGMR